MRTEFHQQLGSLNTDLARMCELAGNAMQRATLGLLTVDLDAAEQVLTELQTLARLRRDVDHAALSVLARQAPVASDLRAVVAAVHISSDADRMGGLAGHVARIVRRRHPESVLPNDVIGQFSEMGSLAVDLAEDAASVIVDGDPVRASRIRDDDEAMNDMHRRLFNTVMSPEWSYGVPPPSTWFCWAGSTRDSPTTRWPSRRGCCSAVPDGLRWTQPVIVTNQ